MKSSLFSALCLGLLLLTGSFKKAEGEKEFIMCIVHGEYSQKEGFDMGNEFKQRYPEVSVCRLDGVSKKFFIIYEADKVSRDNVIDFFAAKKLKATCLHKGIYGKDQVPNITADECK